MLQYIRDNYDALYVTDANGVATSAELLDANGVSLLTGTTPVFQVPNTFASNQWSVATGSNPAEIVINISVLPAANGSPITAIQYRVGTGAWVTLPDAVTGAYPVAMAATSTAYGISLRAINIVGPSAQSVAKTATSGAPAATAPAAFGPAQWSLATGTEPASLALNVISLPANGGSAITAIEYKVGSGEWVALADAETGPRSITMSDPSTAYSVTLRAVNAVAPGNPSAAKTATSAAPAQQAPAVQTVPTISGSTPVGSILTRTAGTATGIPTPTRATVWLRNGTILDGQTGNTLDTSGFAADDIITTRDVWTNSQGSASGTSEPWTLTVQPALTAVVTPNPIVMGEPFTVEFNEEPDDLSSSVTLTGDGTTYGGTGPATSPASIGATKAGFTPYSATITVDTAVITPNAPISTAQLYTGQTVGDIPNFATINNINYFTRTGRTISGVQAKKGQMVSPGEGQPPVLSNLVNVTASTVVNENDDVVIDVLDSGGTTRRFSLAETEYAVKWEEQSDLTWIAKINDLIPGAAPLTFSLLGQTITTSRDALLAGPVNHIAPEIEGTAEVDQELTLADKGVWLGLSAPTFATQWKRGASNISGATADAYTVQAGDAGASITAAVTATNVQGARTASSNAKAIPAVVNQELTFITNAVGATSGSSRTYSGVNIGTAAANRDVFVIVSHDGSVNTPSTGCVIGGVTATAILNLTNTAQGSPTQFMALYHARVPTGATATINTTRAANAINEHITVLVGYDIVVSDTGSSVKSGGTGSTLTATLDAATVGHKVFAFVPFGGLVTFTGATEVFDYEYATGRFMAMAGTVAASPAVSITANRTVAANAAGILMVFSAGAA